MDGFTIRAARPDEYAELGRITAEAYAGDGLLGFDHRDGYRRVLQDVQGRAAHGDVLVAVGDGGGLLGGVTFVDSRSAMSELAGDDEAEFRALAVAQAGRGRGVGGALVAECVERARRLGRLRVVLSTQAAMMPAHRVYERHGFVRAPERDWRPVPDLQLLAYVLELAPAGPDAASGH